MNLNNLKSLIFRSVQFGIPEAPKTADNRVTRLFRELELLWQDWQALVDSADAIQGDATLPEDMRKLRIKRLADSRVTKTAERILRTVGEAETEIRRIESNFEMALKPRSAADEMRRHSLRQALSQLEPNKRIEKVRDAIRSNDLSILDAIASGHSFESDVIDLHFREANRKYRELTAPGDYHALQAMREGIERLQVAAHNFARAARDELVPFDAAAVESRHEAAQNAEKVGE